MFIGLSAPPGAGCGFHAAPPGIRPFPASGFCGHQHHRL